MFVWLFALILTCTAAACVQALTFYVNATGGLDSRNCTTAQTEGTPKLTITSGLTCLVAARGDTLIIKAGNYNERISNPASGASWALPTTIRAATGETATIRPSGTGGPSIQITLARQYIVVDGLGIDGVNCSDIGNNCGIELHNQSGAAHIRFQNMLIQRIPTSAIRVGTGVNDAQVVNNHIRELRNNTTSNTGSVHGIYYRAIGQTTGLVRGNLIEGVTGNGIQVTYSATTPLFIDGLVIENNVFRDDDGLSPGSGIFLGAEARGTIVRNNLFTNLHRGFNYGGTNNVITHNTVFDMVTDLCLGCPSSTINNIFRTGAGTVPAGNYTANPLFVNTATEDFRLTCAPGVGACNTASDGANYGVFRTLRWVSSASIGTTIIHSFAGNIGALSACDASKIHVFYNAAEIAELSCTPGTPQPHQCRCDMASASTAAQTLTMTWDYGAVQDSFAIGGPAAAQLAIGGDNKVLAQAVAQPITNNNVPATDNWQAGNSRSAPTGTNRVCLLGVFYDNTGASAEVTGCTWGGQTGTEIIQTTSLPTGINALAVFLFDEADLAALTSAAISCTVTPTEQADRPPLYVHGCYAPVNQTTPIVASSSASQTSGTSASISSAAIATADGGTAVVFALAGIPGGSWQSFGDGITLQWQGGEDSMPALWGAVGDKNTTGVNVTPSATYTTAATSMSLVGVSVAEEALVIPPVDVPVWTLTASRCADTQAPAWHWQTIADNAPCRVRPGHSLIVAQQVYVTADDEPPGGVSKTLQCCVVGENGDCDEPEKFWFIPEASDGFATRAVNYGIFANYQHATAIAENPLTASPGIFVPGTIHANATSDATVLSSGDFTVQAHALTFSDALAVDTVLHCRLALADGTPLHNYTYNGAATHAVITVGKGKAFGGG